MNVLFISITQMRDLQGSGIYQNLMREFRNHGHSVYVATAYERRFHLQTSLREVDGIHILGVKSLNNVRTNVIEKGISLLMLETLYRKAIEKYLKGISFDIILSSTPPIMFTGVVRSVKRKNPNAFTYLLLKDIFPQNAVDIGMIKKGSFLYSYFRHKEVELYKTFDYIGCMSPANVRYLLEHNHFLNPRKVEIAPNCADITRTYDIFFVQRDIRIKFNLPLDKPIFIYGGNLGKPQGISFLIHCLDANRDRNDCYFVVVGSGTEYKRLKDWMEQSRPNNVSLFEFLPKKEYDMLVQSCDVGLIFLDYRFTIPNYPSRLLAYLENKKPVLIASDPNSDIGPIAEENGYGFWCESKDVRDFTSIVNKMLDSNIREMGERGFEFLKENYLSIHTYEIIMKHSR